MLLRSLPRNFCNLFSRWKAGGSDKRNPTSSSSAGPTLNPFVPPLSHCIIRSHTTRELNAPTHRWRLVSGKELKEQPPITWGGNQNSEELEVGLSD
ncbi:hypothetical protein SLA2020_312610 [Shorea laevis]